MILFLNKIDIFQRKLDAGSLVSRHFPEYRGPNDYHTTTVFFQYRFLQQCKDMQKQVYTHFTHATVSHLFSVPPSSARLGALTVRLVQNGLFSLIHEQLWLVQWRVICTIWPRAEIRTPSTRGLPHHGPRLNLGMEPRQAG